MDWFAGDVLSAFGMWASGAVSAGVGAISVPRGKTKQVLWTLTAAFALGGVVQLIVGARVPLSLLLPLSYMITPPLTVIVVALLVSGKLAPLTSAAKVTEKTERLTLSDERPDIGLIQAVKILSGSIWAEDHKPTSKMILQEMQDKLYMHQLTAFGRREEGFPIEPIPWKIWVGLEIDPQRKAAVTKGSAELTFHDLQFDSDRVHGIWPSRGSWML